MATRSSMATLIARVRTLIGDPSGENQKFSDDDIQNALDIYRDDVRYLELIAKETLIPGSTQWLDFYDDGRGSWEGDVVLYKTDWTAVSPTTSDLLTGHWTFATSQNTPLFLVGKTYDVWHSAADLLEMWAAQEAACSFDFSTGGASFHKSQVPAGRLTLAQNYLRKARIRTVQAVRSDVNVGSY